MNKYLLIARYTWDEILTYRLNFFVWRTRNIFQLITTYFFWSAVVPKSSSFAGYDHSLILTYILGAAFLNSVVFTSRSAGIGDEINQGNLSNFLVRPINYFLFWVGRDAGDKAMNITFAMVEYILFFLLFKPDIFLQTNIFYLAFFSLSLLFAIIITFWFNFLLGSIAFWSSEVWGPRFIFFTITTFFAGGFFPLSILPRFWYILLMATPLPYTQYFPMLIFVGKANMQELLFGFIVDFIWVILLWRIVLFVWKKGLKVYGAEGR